MNRHVYRVLVRAVARRERSLHRQGPGGAGLVVRHCPLFTRTHACHSCMFFVMFCSFSLAQFFGQAHQADEVCLSVGRHFCPAAVHPRESDGVCGGLVDQSRVGPLHNSPLRQELLHSFAFKCVHISSWARDSGVFLSSDGLRLYRMGMAHSALWIWLVASIDRKPERRKGVSDVNITMVWIPLLTIGPSVWVGAAIDYDVVSYLAMHPQDNPALACRDKAWGKLGCRGNCARDLWYLERQY